MEFIRKLLRKGSQPKDEGKEEPDSARGAAPVQTQEEQDETRTRLEAEMAAQREERENRKSEE